MCVCFQFANESLFFYQSVMLEKSHLNITHSRSQIEWSALQKCLATGSPLLLSRMLSLCLFVRSLTKVDV